MCSQGSLLEQIRDTGCPADVANQLIQALKSSRQQQLLMIMMYMIMISVGSNTIKVI